MVVQDWLIALFVTVCATCVMYIIGRRLEGKVAPPLQPPPPQRPQPQPGHATTVPVRQIAAEAPRAPQAPTPATRAATTSTAQVARVDYTEDEENDPTRVGANAPAEPEAPVAPRRVVYSPKIHPIVFDPEVRQAEPAGAHYLVHARAQTDTGLRRKRNEDSLLVLEPEGVFVVADGMGGYRGGELASATAVQTIESAYRERGFEGPAHSGVPADATDLARAIQMANSAILETAQSRPELTGMGTTLCAARFSKNLRRLYIGHVGDSRCYRLRGGVFRQITRDHTMADHGATGAEALQLSRAVGVWPTVPIDIVMAAPNLGDVYLLCSDGLTKMLKDDAIGDVVESQEDPQAAVEQLVASANSRGGRDNISVILVRIVPPNWAPQHLRS